MYGQHNYNANPFAPLGCEIEMHMMPAQRRTFEEHTKTGYYLGNSWEHYRCHEVWINDTRSVRVGQTVFFKHQYLTQPTTTTSDAILKAAANLEQALKGVVPVNGKLRDAIDHLMKIFKGEAKKEDTEVDARRVLRKEAHSQRVETEVASKETTENKVEHEAIVDDVRTTHDLQMLYPSRSEKNNAPAMISQDDGDDAPSRNTRAAARNKLLVAAEISGSCPPARQAASRRYPLQFLVDMAGAVLDLAPGEMLEYRHLIQRPK